MRWVDAGFAVPVICMTSIKNKSLRLNLRMKSRKRLVRIQARCFGHATWHQSALPNDFVSTSHQMLKPSNCLMSLITKLNFYYLDYFYSKGYRRGNVVNKKIRIEPISVKYNPKIEKVIA